MINLVCLSRFSFLFCTPMRKKTTRENAIDWLAALLFDVKGEGKSERGRKSRSFAFFLWYPLSALMAHFLSQDLAFIS
jgi:hypothetical protein